MRHSEPALVQTFPMIEHLFRDKESLVVADFKDAVLSAQGTFRHLLRTPRLYQVDGVPMQYDLRIFLVPQPRLIERRGI